MGLLMNVVGKSKVSLGSSKLEFKVVSFEFGLGLGCDTHWLPRFVLRFQFRFLSTAIFQYPKHIPKDNYIFSHISWDRSHIDTGK